MFFFGEARSACRFAFGGNIRNTIMSFLNVFTLVGTYAKGKSTWYKLSHPALSDWSNMFFLSSGFEKLIRTG